MMLLEAELPSFVLARCHAPKDDAMASNKLLANLSIADARVLNRHLEPVELPVRKQLQKRNSC